MELRQVCRIKVRLIQTSKVGSHAHDRWLMTPHSEADLPAIKAFLRQHITTSMFPLSNLRRYGMNGGHPRAMRFWLRWSGGRITDALGMSEEGFLFPQCPTAPWADVRVVLAGQRVKGLLGEAGQVAAVRRALALPTDASALHEVEPQYHLRLSDLVLPDCAGFSLFPLAEAPRPLITGWRSAYLREVLPTPGEDPDAKAASDIESYLAADSHRVLCEEGQPVAMTGFNAMLPEAVQIGGVYTPPALRSRGLARRAVALHLAEAREAGVAEATLFAASPQASRAYEAIGFTRSGDFTVLVYEHPQVAHG